MSSFLRVLRSYSPVGALDLVFHSPVHGVLSLVSETLFPLPPCENLTNLGRLKEFEFEHARSCFRAYRNISESETTARSRKRLANKTAS